MIGNNELVDNGFSVLQEELRNYNWNYRFKICTKCIGTQQQKDRKCHSVNNFKTIKGNRIQETHCDWLTKARSHKFRGRINNLLNMAHFTMFGKGKYKKTVGEDTKYV